MLLTHEITTSLRTCLISVLVQIVLNANEVQLRGLPVSQPNMNGRLWDGVYEVCACASGALYLVPAAIAMTDGCRADGGICRT